MRWPFYCRGKSQVCKETKRIGWCISFRRDSLKENKELPIRLIYSKHECKGFIPTLYSANNSCTNGEGETPPVETNSELAIKKKAVSEPESKLTNKFELLRAAASTAITNFEQQVYE